MWLYENSQLDYHVCWLQRKSSSICLTHLSSNQNTSNHLLLLPQYNMAIRMFCKIVNKFHWLYMYITTIYMYIHIYVYLYITFKYYKVKNSKVNPASTVEHLEYNLNNLCRVLNQISIYTHLYSILYQFIPLMLLLAYYGLLHFMLPWSKWLINFEILFCNFIV